MFLKGLLRYAVAVRRPAAVPGETSAPALQPEGGTEPAHQTTAGGARSEADAARDILRRGETHEDQQVAVHGRRPVSHRAAGEDSDDTVQAGNRGRHHRDVRGGG